MEREMIKKGTIIRIENQENDVKWHKDMAFDEFIKKLQDSNPMLKNLTPSNVDINPETGIVTINNPKPGVLGA